MLGAVTPNTARTLYRSVSPWEMADILDKQAITGRGGQFAGDRRRSDDCYIWLGTDISNIIHSGEDYFRYFQSLPLWDGLLAAEFEVRKIRNAVSRERLDTPYSPRSQALLPLQHKATDIVRELSEAYRKAIYGLNHEAHEYAERLPTTSYIVEVQDAPGGTSYTAPDALQDGTEVCFPTNAAHMLYQHVVAMHLVKRKQIIGTLAPADMDLYEVVLPRVKASWISTALRQYDKLKVKIAEVLS
jgi:hypothetical protein